jgi:two-component system heavy metal sensor histidine kinase CusS
MFLNSAPKTARQSWSLAARLTVSYMISAFAMVVVASTLLYVGLVRNLEEEDDQFLRERVTVLQGLMEKREDSIKELRWEIETEPPRLQPTQLFVRILDSDSHVFLETPGMRSVLPADLFPEIASKVENSSVKDVQLSGNKTFRLLTIKVAARGNKASPGVIEAALDRTGDEELLAHYRSRLALVLAATVLLSGIVGYHIAHRGIRPIREIAATAGRIRSSTLDERLRSDGLPAELSTLAITFNGMMDRLEQSFERLSRFSADIAHELRTPLNNLRGEAEVALRKARSVDEYQEVLASSLEEYERLARIIDSLLFIARSEDPEAQIVTEPVDLGKELEKTKDFYEPAAAEKGVHLVVEADRNISASIDRTLLQRAVGNLVSNALTHTPPGGYVKIRAILNGASVRVEISDTGFGIAEQHLPHVFDRFYQVDSSRAKKDGHVGLGLAIVKAIATVHRGSVEISSRPGEGTQVAMTLPNITTS